MRKLMELCAVLPDYCVCLVVCHVRHYIESLDQHADTHELSEAAGRVPVRVGDDTIHIQLRITGLRCSVPRDVWEGLHDNDDYDDDDQSGDAGDGVGSRGFK